MKLDTSGLVSKSIRLGLREPRLWAFGVAMFAMAFASRFLLQTVADPMHPVRLVVSLLQMLARTALLIGLSRQCLAVVRGERLIARDAFTTVGKNWASIFVFGTAMWAINRALVAPMQQLREGHVSLPIFLAILPSAFVAVAIYMVLSVLAREALGPVAAFRRTLQIFGEVWSARLRGLLAISLRFLLPLLCFVILFTGALMLAKLEPERGTWVLAVVEMLFFSILVACDQLFDVSVYLAATEGDADCRATQRARPAREPTPPPSEYRQSP